LISLVACALGVASHFYPIPFPTNKPLLIGCVAGYVVCASLYYLIERYMEGDVFFLGRSHNINALKDFQRIRFSSDLHVPEKQAEGVSYTLKVESTGVKGKIEVSRKWDAATFYDEHGYLHRYKVREAFEETLQKMINSPR
jgi:Microsomal signal peptidase 25 kDa subunit (SPC25)